MQMAQMQPGAEPSDDAEGESSAAWVAWTTRPSAFAKESLDALRAERAERAGRRAEAQQKGRRPAASVAASAAASVAACDSEAMGEGGSPTCSGGETAALLPAEGELPPRQWAENGAAGSGFEPISGDCSTSSLPPNGGLGGGSAFPPTSGAPLASQALPPQALPPPQRLPRPQQEHAAPPSAGMQADSSDDTASAARADDYTA